MSLDKVKAFIAGMPVGAAVSLQEQDDTVTPITSVDLNQIPTGVVTGSNLLQFPSEASQELRSSVALSLLAAQRVASNTQGIATPDAWLEAHNMVLTNLNWLKVDGGHVVSEFDTVDAAVHTAIIPFLTAALGGAVAAGSLIVTALNQLREMNKNDPWITLFDRESRRFDVTEYQFTIVTVVGNQTFLQMAAARFSAEYGRTQVLFFKVRKASAKFQTANAKFSADTQLLTDINGPLKAKLAVHASQFISSLPDALLN